MGMQAKNVFAKTRQIEKLGELKSCLKEDWDQISLQYLRTLIASMFHRSFQVKERPGKKTDHYFLLQTKLIR